jgi:hypothetical protein
MALDWNNKQAIDAVTSTMAQFGVPSSVDATSGGIVIWKKDRLLNSCLDRIEIRDEAIPHNSPQTHNDCVYVFVTYDVSPIKFMEVTSISGSVTYDPLKKQLRVRCQSIEACVATLALCVQVGEGALSLNYAQSNELFSQYIFASQDANQYEKLRDLLCYTLEHQKGTTMSEGEWALSSNKVGLPLPRNLFP